MECALIHPSETARTETHSLTLTRPGPPSSALQIECVLWSVFRWDIIYIFSLICKPRRGVLHATAPTLSLVYVTRSDKHTHSPYQAEFNLTYVYKHQLLCLLHLLRTTNIWHRQFYWTLEGCGGEERRRFDCNLMVSRIIIIAIQMCCVAPFMATADKCFWNK